MDKLEARKALNRLQIVYKRLQARYKDEMPMLFYEDDDIYKIGEDASNLYLYCQIEKDIEIMKECSMFSRYLIYQVEAREHKRENKPDRRFFKSLGDAVNYLRETETLYICTCWRLTEREACGYFIDKEDGQCKSKVTREVLEIPTYTYVHERAEIRKSPKIAPKSPQITEGQTLSLNEKLAFVPVDSVEQAKKTFQSLLADGWMTETPKGFVWKDGTSKSLICFFADLANDKWHLRESKGYGKSDWKDFAELFGMKSQTFINWKSDQRNHTGTQDPKGGDNIRGYFD